MSLSVGIVGLPNVGKSTLFNALLKKQAALAANYPFATIEPNTGIVEVPDERLVALAGVISKGEDVKNVPLVPATVEFVDIAGLVAGASQGEGLGNKFLATIRETDLICHVLRAFEDGDVVLTGEMEPLADLETIRAELILKDLDFIAGKRSELEKKQRGGDKEATQKLACLDKLDIAFNDGVMASKCLNTDELALIRDWWLLTAKPEIFVINVSEEQLGSGATETVLKEFSEKLAVSESDVVVICAKVEAELGELDAEEQMMFLEEMGLSESGIGRMAKAAYAKLGLISYLTAGEIECRAWTVRKGAMAPEAAGVIHTDFEKKFIKADVIHWKDFVEYGGWKRGREVGKVRMEGKDYVIQDGDVVDFKIGA